MVVTPKRLHVYCLVLLESHFVAKDKDEHPIVPGASPNHRENLLYIYALHESM